MVQGQDRRRVLVVDDEVFVRLLVADVLDEAGFEVVEAADARTALKRLELADDVQVLFTDINMPPGMNGLDLAEQVHQRWPEVGIVVSSGYERPSHEQIADSGIFVPKPFRPDDIVRAVRKVAARE
jgi:two-component system, response regulator PdtaR